MAAKKPQAKLNRELKKAVHSGDGYDDYMTVYQFQQQKLAMVRNALKRAKHGIDDFYYDGGEIIQGADNVFIAVMDGVELRVVYDKDGDVSDYSITGMKGKSQVAKRILNLFFDEHLIAIFEEIIKLTEEQLKNMDNDNTLRGLFELRDIMRSDKYLTASAISGLDIAMEDDPGLFDFTEEE